MVSRVSPQSCQLSDPLTDNLTRSILGPTLGGALARPVLSYPHIFAPGTIWERFPYLLPNLVCTVIVACGVVVGILFLEETHEEKKFRRDPGLEAGKWILQKITRCADVKASRCEKVADPDLDEVLLLLSEEDQLPSYRTTDVAPPGYRTTEGSPKLPSTPSPEPQEALDLNEMHVSMRSKPAATKAFTRQVVTNIVGYGILA
jgi:hypothetical protein